MITREEGTARLLLLASFLDTMPAEKFNYNVIMKVAGKPPLEALAAGHHPCGTVGCAIGWMPAVFPNDVEWVPSNNLEGMNILLKDTWETGFSAAAAFFDLTLEQVYDLFDPFSNSIGLNASSRRVASWIREYIEDNDL